MEKELGKEYTNPDERKAFLADNCDVVEQLQYMKRFNAAEMQGVKEELANVSIQIADLEEELADVKRDYKERLKPLRETRDMRVADVKAKGKNVTEPCYKFIDREARMTAYYNAEGDLVTQRPATADEMQPTLFMKPTSVAFPKDGTND